MSLLLNTRQVSDCVKTLQATTYCIDIIKAGFLRLSALVTGLILLSACQTLPLSNDTDGQWQTDPQMFSAGLAGRAQMNRWRYSAKVGITTQSLREQANLVWVYADQSNSVRLFGPLGVGAIKLEFDQNGVQLSDNKGVLHHGDSAEGLLNEIVGWPIPIDALSYWLYALPSPGRTFEYQLDDQKQLKVLRQLGWDIHYANYKNYGASDRVLARKITATKSIAPEQSITVKLITKTWQ